MFERMTDRGRRVVILAQDEARTLNHNYIGTEHILLGLIAEGEGIGCQALTGLGLKLSTVRGAVIAATNRGGVAPTGHIPFTPRAKKVLELSLREALQLGHNYIGTEHILLGLLREGEGVGAGVLTMLGLGLTDARHKVIAILSRDEQHQVDDWPTTTVRMYQINCSYCRQSLTGTYPSHPAAVECAKAVGAVLISPGHIACRDCLKRPLGDFAP